MPTSNTTSRQAPQAQDGDTLPPNTYRVAKGDTFWGISKAVKVDIHDMGGVNLASLAKTKPPDCRHIDFVIRWAHYHRPCATHTSSAAARSP